MKEQRWIVFVIHATDAYLLLCLTVNTEISVLNIGIPCYVMVSKDSSNDKYTETNSNKQTIVTLVSHGQT